MMPDWFNVLDYGPLLRDDEHESDGVDVTGPIQALLTQRGFSTSGGVGVPAAHAFIPHSDRREHAAVIYFPTLEGKTHYIITERLILPGNRSVRFLAGAPTGARLRFVPRTFSDAPNPAIRGPMITARSGRRHLVFENLIFDGGAVELDGPVIGPTEFRSCVFTRIRGYALRTMSKLVVDVTVSGCKFVETERGIGVLHRGCDNWLINNNTSFVRLAGEGVRINSSGVSVKDCRFEDQQAFTVGDDSLGEPYIAISSQPHDPRESQSGFTGGLCEIDSCRFGGEVGTDFRPALPDTKPDDVLSSGDTAEAQGFLATGPIASGMMMDEDMFPETKPKLFGPPAFAIRIDSATGNYVTGVHIRNSRFFGRTQDGGPTDTSARGAIHLQRPLVDSVVMGNFFRPYFGPIIVADRHATDKQVKFRRNLLVANTFEPTRDDDGKLTRAKVFEGNEAEDWEIIPPL